MMAEISIGEYGSNDKKNKLIGGLAIKYKFEQNKIIFKVEKRKEIWFVPQILYVLSDFELLEMEANGKIKKCWEYDYSGEDYILKLKFPEEEIEILKNYTFYINVDYRPDDFYYFKEFKRKNDVAW